MTKSDGYCTENWEALVIAVSNHAHSEKCVYRVQGLYYESYLPTSWLHIFQRYSVLFEELSNKFTCQSG